jgi:hypothetical protein
VTYVTYTAKRDLVGSGTNVLTNQESFSSSTWVMTGGIIVTSGFTISAPDLSGFSAKFVENTSSGNHGVLIENPTLVNTYATFSLYAQAAERRWMRISVINKDGSIQQAYYDVGSGVVGTVTSGATATMTNVGSNWYRVALTLTVMSGGFSPVYAIRTASNNNVLAHAGVASSGMYWWGAMANTGLTAKEYPHSSGRTYNLRFDLLALTRDSKFDVVRQTALNGSRETLFHRQENFYAIGTQYLTEAQILDYREFIASTVGGETFQMNLYDTISELSDLRSYVMESSEYTEDRRGSLFVYSINFKVRAA